MDATSGSETTESRTSETHGLIAALKQTTFRSLQHRHYRRYFYGQIVSFTGTWMQSAALMWLMYDRTGDPRWPSWLLVAQVGPTILFGAWGGYLADRWPKRHLIFCTQCAFLANAVLLTLLVGSGFAVPLAILGLQMLSGVVQAIDLPARLAFVPDLIPKEDLINAVGLNSLLFNSARAIGPAIAGLFFLLADFIAPHFPGTNAVTLGAAGCFGLNAVSFVAVLFALHSIRVPGDTRRTTSGEGSMLDGVRYLLAQPMLAALVGCTLIVCIFAWPVLTLMPAYTRITLGLAEKSYSVMVSSLGAGALVAALGTATFGSTARRMAFLVVGSTITASGLFGLAAAHELVEAALCCAAVGFGLVLYLSTGQSTLQLTVPDAMRGRVMALWAMTLSASAPLGHLIAGEAVTEFGVGTVLLAMATGVALVAVGITGLVLGRGRWKQS